MSKIDVLTVEITDELLGDDEFKQSLSTVETVEFLARVIKEHDSKAHASVRLGEILVSLGNFLTELKDMFQVFQLGEEFGVDVLEREQLEREGEIVESVREAAVLLKAYADKLAPSLSIEGEKISQDVLRNVLYYFGDHEYGWEPGSFTQSLIQTVNRADRQNKAKLSIAYPQVVHAVIIATERSNGMDEMRRAVRELGK